jgi:hypothetical protein
MTTNIKWLEKAWKDRKDLVDTPCVRKVVARIGSEALGAQEDGRGSIRTAI